MKLWSWGQSEVGIVNQSALMDDGSLYAETQCGAMETQLDFDFLQPGETNKWREWWLPLRGMGGMTCASADMGARLHLALGEEEGTMKLTIGICPAIEVPSAQIELSIPGESLLQETAPISPDEPWLKEITIEAQKLAAHPLTLVVKDDQGQSLLDYTHSPSHTPVSSAKQNHPPNLRPRKTSISWGSNTRTSITGPRHWRATGRQYAPPKNTTFPPAAGADDAQKR